MLNSCFTVSTVAGIFLLTLALADFTFDVFTSQLVTTISYNSKYAVYTTVCLNTNGWCGQGWNEEYGMDGLIVAICKTSDMNATLYYSLGAGKLYVWGTGANTNDDFEENELVFNSSCAYNSSAKTITLSVSRPLNGVESDPVFPKVSESNYSWIIAASGTLYSGNIQMHTLAGGQQVSLTSVAPPATPSPSPSNAGTRSPSSSSSGNATSSSPSSSKGSVTFSVRRLIMIATALALAALIGYG